ncbi:UNVERIFIED_CONTAM: Zn-dependent protease [Acetivibrio alkalicellulosi]
MFGNLDPVRILYLLIVFAFSVSFHESAHAYVAYRLGDPTAKDLGRITLNPIKHLDLFGTIMIIVASIGWAKPVPVNPSYFKNRKQGSILVSLAGPVSNLILAVFFTFIYLLVGLRYGLDFWDIDLTANDPISIIFNFSYLGMYLNILLAVFNFIPIPPLDGSKIIGGFLPERYYFKMIQFQGASFLILMLLAYTGVLEMILIPMYLFVQNTLVTVILPVIRLIA